MISLRYLQMKKVKDVLDTAEEIKDVRQRLEDATQDSIIAYGRAKRRAQVLAYTYCLD